VIVVGKPFPLQCRGVGVIGQGFQQP
jgi:hypothetical protein